MPIDRNGGQYITANPQQPTQSSAPGIWDIDEQGSAQAAGRWPLPPNVVQRSLRFNSADSAYLGRTPATASNRKTWTWSGWVKRAGLGASRFCLFGAGASTNQAYILFEGDQIDFLEYQAAVSGRKKTTAVFRDPSSWYHVVCIFDTTNGTPADRMQIWINGVRQTALAISTDPSLNLDGTVDSTVLHAVGREELADTDYFSGYMAEVNFVDGQALTPSSFGQTDAQTGQWIPRVYSGSYGTNGYRLQFLDNSGTTATTLGKDTSGMGNNWTPNNFSVAAGSGNDSLRDVPMNYYSPDNGLGGEVIGNYCTWNPLNATSASTANGNLEATLSGNAGLSGQIRGTIAPSSGKWFWESTITADGNQSQWLGVVAASSRADLRLDNSNALSQVIYARYDGTKIVNGSAASSYGASYAPGDVIGAALDLDAGTVTFYKNGVSQGLLNLPTAGIAYVPVFWYSTTATSGTIATNFGQRPFAYTAPSGFKALCTQNFSAPRIGNVAVAQADDFFNAVVYTGNGNTSPGQLVTTGFQPDLVWIKERSSTEWHQWYDALRSTNALFSNTADAELPLDGVTLQSNGFYAKDNARTNQNTEPYVGWCWNAGGSTVTNTSGSITSSVRASQTAGFSVVGYAGNSTAGATVGHGLGAAPAMVIYRLRNATSAWIVYHQAITSPAINCLRLNETTAASSAGGAFNSTAPTSTLLTLGGPSVGTNDSGYNFVAYCFAAVPGFSAFGSYTGNNSTDGTFVYLGFRPRFVLIKSTSATTEWVTMDTSRSPYNLAEAALYANRDYSETTIGAVNDIDFLSNGFKLRNTTGFVNAAQTYIYAAFAEIPFQFANAR